MPLLLAYLYTTTLLLTPAVVVHGLATPSRRKWLAQAVATVTASSNLFPSQAALDELPMALRDYTKLAPLGDDRRRRRNKESSLEGKTRNLSLSELASRLEVDLAFGHTGQGGYFISGDLDESIFRDDCVFVDPTNRVDSLAQYRTALKILFDPVESQVQVLGPLVVDQTQNTIRATIRSRGVLQLPWRPYITAYESTIVYRIDDDSGLIAEQSQTWTKAASQALRESFTPGWFRPPPKSTLSVSSSSSSQEPAVVTQLFHYVNGRRPYEYSDWERLEINALIDEISSRSTNMAQQPPPTSEFDFQPDRLSGKWMLVYLQPGPTGMGIDRRIPFPELDFNDSFQIFSRDSVVNLGQLLGPIVQVSVQGSLTREETVPRRFKAQINGGKLCVQQACIGLPISGEGLFDSVYVGERLRIGQNINGGGARVVQVRLEQ